ncbi:MAG: ubiquinol-cytochrome c reductase cytochrome b subunit [Solirubrobacteraceae bacterium]|nr:ubiquinol-cytochrome c reductase cytochrome b subunit [Solirubrobacteraceae bacterium]
MSPNVSPNPAVRFIDERTGAAPLMRKVMRYVFPEHGSFLLGEIALYAFLVLVATGIYLALFFDPSLADTTYNGTYAPLRGLHMSQAYTSAIDLSFDDRTGLLMRQTHHWAADVFLVSIVLHLMRVFFTGAFRRPRVLTWTLGVAMLFAALLEGFLGYSVVDDLLSGAGLAIGYGVALSVPLVGGNLALGLWGAPFPGDQAFESRMFIAHVLLLPGLIGALLTGHLALIAARHHTQFRRSPRQTERRLLGLPTFPAQTPRSLGLLFATAAVLFGLGGLVQVNPVWLWGPFELAQGTNGAQPDWYLGWLIGALRLMPGFDVTIRDYTLIPNPFWGGVLFPTVVMSTMFLWPWIERRATGDRAVHNLLDRPRDAPGRTAFGVAFFVWVVLIFLAGSADRVYVFFDLSYDEQIWFYRVVVWIAPVVAFLLTRRICRELQRSDAIRAERERAEREAEQELVVRPAPASRAS